MNMELGKKIKTLRLERNMTQEHLAEALKVTPQAVSKWENGVSAPDISMLPAISIVFGVTIDDLFSLNDDENLERIGNMLNSVRDLTESTFASAETQLKGIASRKPGCGDAYLRMAQLYEHRIATMTRSAVGYAKQSIMIEPDKKAGHSLMTNLLGGYGGDWTCNNTLEMVRYYRGLMKKVPDWQQGWGWLLDQLIGNGLLGEAEAVVRNTAFKHDELAKARLGDIAYARGDGEKALKLWQECIDDAPCSWRPYAWRADKMVFMGRYEDAIRDYTAWLKRQPAPRYVDPCICMSLLYEEMGDIQNAIKMREEQYSIYKNEHHFEDGEAYDSIMREIDRLRAIG